MDDEWWPPETDDYFLYEVLGKSCRHLTRKERYLAYLRTDIWQKKREEALIRAERMCEKCHTSRYLDVHHKNYHRVGGDELPRDLQVLCRPCHRAAHVTVDQRSAIIESLRRKDSG